MTLRRLVPADAPAYRALLLEGYERHPEAFTASVAERGALPLSWWEARVQAGTQPAEMVLGAFVERELAGVAGLRFQGREKLRHKATLFGMYVAPGHRRLGLGRALVLAVLAAARQRAGIRVVQLTVTEGNEGAQALYESCGFVPFGREPLAVAVGPRLLGKVHSSCDLAALSCDLESGRASGAPRGS